MTAGRDAGVQSKSPQGSLKTPSYWRKVFIQGAKIVGHLDVTGAWEHFFQCLLFSTVIQGQVCDEWEVELT